MKNYLKKITISTGLLTVMAMALYYPVAVFAQTDNTDNGTSTDTEQTTPVNNDGTTNQDMNASTTPGNLAALGLLNDRRFSLGDLFVLNQLFTGGTGGVISTDSNNLGDLFVLDRLFGNRSSILSGNRTDLGDLFILNNLFGGKNVLGTTNVLGGNNSLGNLILLDELFGDGGGLGGGVFGGGNDLGDLLILNNLFGK